jgi:hypothetical protein
MCDNNIELKSTLRKMTNEEVINELYGMRNLAISLYRNDEGTEYSEEYRRFHQCLKLLEIEARQRGLHRDT